MKDVKQGSFYTDLTKNFKQIKEARALSVAEDTEIAYKRKIEDLCREYNTMLRNRKDLMLDMYPAAVTSTSVVPADFKPEAFLEKDLAIGIEARELKIKLEIMVERYEARFGQYPDMDSVNAILSNETQLEEE